MERVSTMDTDWGFSPIYIVTGVWGSRGSAMDGIAWGGLTGVFAGPVDLNFSS